MSEAGAWPRAGAAACGQLLGAHRVHSPGAPHFAAKKKCEKLYSVTYHFGAKEAGSEDDPEFTLF